MRYPLKLGDRMIACDMSPRAGGIWKDFHLEGSLVCCFGECVGRRKYTLLNILRTFQKLGKTICKLSLTLCMHGFELNPKEEVGVGGESHRVGPSRAPNQCQQLGATTAESPALQFSFNIIASLFFTVSRPH
jgi:hypothetical protein